MPDVKYQFARTTYKYDGRGMRVEETNYGLDGEVTSKRVMKYNEFNDIIASADSISDIPRRNTVFACDYSKYDKQHNWLIKNTVINGKPHGVFKRYITYYK